MYWALFFSSLFIWCEEPRHLRLSKHSPPNLSTLWSWLSVQAGLRRHTQVRYLGSNLLFFLHLVTSLNTSKFASFKLQRSLNHKRSRCQREVSNSDRGWKVFFKSTQYARKTKLHPNYQLMNDLTEKSALKLQQATLPSFPLHPEAGSDAPSPCLWNWLHAFFLFKVWDS